MGEGNAEREVAGTQEEKEMTPRDDSDLEEVVTNTLSKKQLLTVILWAASVIIPTNLGIQMTGVFRNDPFTGTMGRDLEDRQKTEHIVINNRLLVLETEVATIKRTTPSEQMAVNTSSILRNNDRIDRLEERVRDLEEQCRKMGHNTLK